MVDLVGSIEQVICNQRIGGGENIYPVWIFERSPMDSQGHLTWGFYLNAKNTAQQERVQAIMKVRETPQIQGLKFPF